MSLARAAVGLILSFGDEESDRDAEWNERLGEVRGVNAPVPSPSETLAPAQACTNIPPPVLIWSNDGPVSQPSPSPPLPYVHANTSHLRFILTYLSHCIEHYDQPHNAVQPRERSRRTRNGHRRYIPLRRRERTLSVGEQWKALVAHK